MMRPSFSITAAVLASLFACSEGQEICACAPGSFTFLFDLGQSCPPKLIDDFGVNGTFCGVQEVPGTTVTDFVPVSIQKKVQSFLCFLSLIFD